MTAGAHAFPKSDRLLLRREFLRLEAEGVRVREGGLSASALQNPLGRRRLGLAVSRRIGNAVVRNRAKRILREVFRHHREALPPSIDLVLVPTRTERAVDHGHATEDFLRLAAKVHRALAKRASS